MIKYSHFEFPEHLKKDFEKAKRLEWITIFYLLSTSLLVALTMGSSQSMKTAWFEDLISLTPSISFLIAARICHRPPNKRFPFGFHRVVSIAYLCSSLALFSVGAFLLYDSVLSLLEQDHATVGTVVIFGQQIWQGYLMIAVMLYGIFPAYFLGKKKLPLSRSLHDPILYTDAKMNKADWMTASGTIIGVIGIGFGWWWLDAIAAILISLDILHDGFRHLRQSVFDLMDEVPKTLDLKQDEPLIDQILTRLRSHPSVKDAGLRLREEGHVFTGQGFVVWSSETVPTSELEALAENVKNLDWRMSDFDLIPVRELEHK